MVLVVVLVVGQCCNSWGSVASCGAVVLVLMLVVGLVVLVVVQWC